MKWIKKILVYWLILSVMSICSILSVYADNEQSSEESIQEKEATEIYTAQQLANIANDLSGSYILCNDIDLSAFASWKPIGTKENPFTGKLDGNGHVVSNILIKVTEQQSVNTEEYTVGLFGGAENCEIVNLGVENGNYTVMAADKAKTNFVDVGGIIGYGSHCTVRRCYYRGKISNTVKRQDTFNRTGGIAAVFVHSVMTDCYTNISIEGSSVSSNVMLGGITAWSEESQLKRCYATGSIQLNDVSNIAYMGGISASGGGVIERCLSFIVDFDTTKAVEDAYSDTIGSFSECKSCFALKLTEDPAEQQSVYEGLKWDFKNTWVMGKEYPVLKCFDRMYDEEEVTETEPVETIALGRKSQVGPIWFAGVSIILLVLSFFVQGNGRR